MWPADVTADPLLFPTLRVVAGLFGLGLLLVLFFARHDLRAGLRGELGQRLLGWLLLAIPFLFALFGGTLIAAILLGLFLTRALLEYVRVVGVRRPYTWYLAVLAPLTVGIAALAPALYAALPAAAILLLTLVPLLEDRKEELYNQLSLAGRGYLYVVWSLGHLVLLRAEGGAGLLLLVGVGVALTDVMQYTVGKLFGRRVIAPSIHPAKAWEGIVGDLLGAALAVTLLGYALPEWLAWPHRLLLVVALGIGAAWGDLLSSLIKRVAGAKDWGRLIPGHGGLLDRANSLVVVAPIVYYIVIIFQP